MWLRLITLTLALSLTAFAEQSTIPTTLAEAHLQLEKALPQEELAKIDAMPSEDQMVRYHMGVGTGMRNDWGLWKGGPLARHMKQLGFTHPDDMSATILETFWCKRHGQDFRLKERAEYYAIYWKAVAEPPATARDPQDSSEIEWSFSFGYGDDQTPREIHIGKSNTGQVLAYEHDKGVYLPGKDILDHIAEFEKQNK